MAILELRDIGYRYGNGKMVLEDVNYSFEAGKMYGIVGKSGSGKTTLLSLLAGLTVPATGKILYENKDIAGMNRYDYRSHQVGVIFQSFNLLPKLSAMENIQLSMDISGIKGGKAKSLAAREVLDKVGLAGKEGRRVLKLSGGEQQRVAIARALSYGPKIILADEPTGNLDPGTEMQILDILEKLAKEEGKCVIIVTHSPTVRTRMDEVYDLEAALQKA